MTWPQATDYNAAVQNPQVCFRDDDLRQGQVVGDLFGLPRPHSGNFADVYQIQGADNHGWAVKCFTRPVANLHQRYQAICDHLRQTQRAFMVEFHYLEEGICIRGQWYPLVKMRWVEGFALNEFIRQHMDKPVLLERLAQMWLRLGQELRDADMAHGDLQHGNVLLVPGSKSSSLALKLIDYDGMFVPELAETPSGEIGHPNYQHPQRLREGAYDREIDRFSHLLIYTALRCLRAGGAELWQRYDNLENLLFREEDFRQPAGSRLLRDLWRLKDRDARHLLGHLLLASQGPLLVVPSLDELVDEDSVRPLSDSEETQVNALLRDSAASPRKSRVVVPATPVARVIEMESASATVLVATPAQLSSAETMPDGVSLEQTKPGRPSLPPPPLPRSARRASSALLLSTREPLRRAPEAASLMDPVVAILSRPGWLAALGAIALVSFLVVNVLVWSSVKPSAAASHVQRPHLHPLANVTIEGGHKHEMLLIVERHDCCETLRIQVEGLPPNMKAPLLSLAPEQDTVSLTLLAPLAGQSVTHDVTVSLWQSDERIDERPFRLTVQPSARPVMPQLQAIPTVKATPQSRLKIQELADSLSVVVGETSEIRVGVQRGNYQGPVEIRVEGLPAGAMARAATIPAGQSFASVTVATPAEMEAGQSTVALTAWVDGQTADTRKIALHVEDPLADLSVEKPAGQQQVQPERVTFTTVDHVKLVGMLYPGSKGKNGACVLMLPELGKRRRTETAAWQRLAEALQAEGHTVLTFDFRGQGPSKRVTPDFWKLAVNRGLPVYDKIKWEEGLPETIASDDFSALYMPWMIHDIAAARMFLDVRHEDSNSPVNSANLMIFGVGRGAALGSLWLASEGIRYDAQGAGDNVKIVGLKNRDILRGIWLDIETNWKDHEFPVPQWVSWAHRLHPDSEIPIDFVFGAEDVKAYRLVRELIGAGHGNSHPIPGTSLSGLKLLVKDQRSEKYIQKYLVHLLNAYRCREWVPRQLVASRSYWGFPTPARSIDFYLAKRPGEQTLRPVPLRGFGIRMEGLPEPRPILPGKE